MSSPAVSPRNIAIVEPALNPVHKVPLKTKVLDFALKSIFALGVVLAATAGAALLGFIALPISSTISIIVLAVAATVAAAAATILIVQWVRNRKAAEAAKAEVVETKEPIIEKNDNETKEVEVIEIEDEAGKPEEKKEEEKPKTPAVEHKLSPRAANVPTLAVPPAESHKERAGIEINEKSPKSSNKSVDTSEVSVKQTRSRSPSPVKQ